MEYQIKNIEGFPGYKIDTNGVVWSCLSKVAGRKREKHGNILINFKAMIQKVVLEEVKNETKTSKGGKQYTACEIKVNGTWRQGFGSTFTKTWQPGQTVEVELMEEEWNGKIYKKFKAIGRQDILEERLKKLESRMDQAARVILELTSNKGGAPF